MKSQINSAAKTKLRNRVINILGSAVLAGSVLPASADLYQVTGGSVSMTITEGLASSVDNFDAYFDATATRAQTLSDPAPGNAPFAVNGATVTVVDPIRPYGVVPSPYPGTPGSTRSPQMTTLEFDSNDVLGSWSLSNDSFGFVGNTTLGEQIALTSMQRWTGPFSGALLYGDFGLRRVSATELALTSNIDFLNADFADIVNPTISVTDDTLTISGDLLMGNGLYLLDPSVVPGTDFGTFTMTAGIAAVPEPSALALLGLGAVVPLLRRIPRLNR